MCRNVVISPVISGPIILAIISAGSRQLPAAGPLWPAACTLGRCTLAAARWPLPAYNGPDARRRPCPVGGPVPADHPHRQARGHGGARDDARAVSAVPAHPD